MATTTREDAQPGTRGAGVYIAFGVIVVLAAIAMFVATGAFRGGQLPGGESSGLAMPDASAHDAAPVSH